jgi:hypothetical protein
LVLRITVNHILRVLSLVILLLQRSLAAAIFPSEYIGIRSLINYFSRKQMDRSHAFDDLSPIEAEILCEMRMADIPRPVVQQELTEERPLPQSTASRNVTTRGRGN